jgi:phosphoserine aminotransferase
MARKHNFGAGPAGLPTSVLEIAQNELLDFKGEGMSIMEMSHRSKTYDAVHQAAEANVRKLMNVSDEYDVLFLQGGASQQFATLPLNLRLAGQTADYVVTGSWSSKALKEGKTPGAAYVHICSNETIEGIRFNNFPQTDAPLIADMSSEIMSRVIDVNKFGMIYAGAQKNIGPSGLALVIIKKELVARCPDTVPVFFRYKTHAENQSLYNTPNTWAIYIVKLVTDWLLGLGGVAGMEKINEEKAALLYKTLDASAYWTTPANKADRSSMNVVWRLPSEELEEKFVKQATAAGLIGLKGHRSVGGIRASIYNACSLDDVKALCAFMAEFEKSNG